MPTFEIALEDGRKFRVDADDQQAALAGVQQHVGGGGVDLGTKTADGKGLVGVAPFDPNNPQPEQPATAAAPAQKPSTGVLAGLQQGISDVVGGPGKTLRHYSPFGDTGKSLEKTGAELAPQNYQPRQIIGQDGSVDIGAAPEAVARAAPGMATMLAAAKLFSKVPRVGPAAAALLGAGGTAAVTQLGQRAEDRAAAAGEDPQNPSTTSKAAAAASTAASVPLEALGAARFLPGMGGAARHVGSRGVAEAGGRWAKTAAIEGATETADNGVEQTGRTLGTPGGLKIDPIEAANAGATGVAAGGMFSSTRAAREAGQARRYRDIDTEVAPEVANDISRNAQDASLLRRTFTPSGSGSDKNLGVSGGFDAVRRTEQDYRSAIAPEIRALRKADPSDDGELNGALTRAARGEINDADAAAIKNAGGDAVLSIAKKLTTLQRLKNIGYFEAGKNGKGKFKGGTGAFMEDKLWFLTNPAKYGMYTGASAVTGAALNPGMMVHSAPIVGGLAGVYGGARILDRSMGTRSPARAFVERFGGHARPNAAPIDDPEPAPEQPQGGPQGPWGPIPTPNAAPTRVPNVRQPNTLPAVIPQPFIRKKADNTVYGGAPESRAALPAPEAGPGSRYPRASGDVINQPADAQPLLPSPASFPIPQGGPAPQLALPAPSRVQLPDVIRAQMIVPRKPQGASSGEQRKEPSALAKKLAAEHNARVKAERDYKPVVDDGEARPTKLTMAEEVNEQDVIDALREGKNTIREIRASTGIDSQDLNATLNRMKVEGKVLIDGAGVKLATGEKPKAKLPAEVTAQAKLPKVEIRSQPEKPVAEIRPQPDEDGFGIPDFLKRVKPASDNSQKTPEPAKRLVYEVDDNGPALSPHFGEGKVDDAVRSATEDFLKGKGMTLDGPKPDWAEKSVATIDRVIRRKYATAEAIEKEVSGFDRSDFASRYLHSRSFADGADLKDYLNRKYPTHSDVFDRLLSDAEFKSVYPAKSAKPKIKSADTSSLISALREAGTDRSTFDVVIADLKAANLSNDALFDLARTYSNSVTKYKSKAAAYDDISKAFVRQARFENKLR